MVILKINNIFIVQMGRKREFIISNRINCTLYQEASKTRATYIIFVQRIPMEKQKLKQ